MKLTEEQFKGPWTQFMDMHSGGGQKLDWGMIYIQASEAEAEIIFQNMFGRNPHRVTCTCCGSDYSLTEEKEDLAQATAYARGCDFAHFDKDGVELPVARKYGTPQGSVTRRYVERAASDRFVWHDYQTLEDYLKDKNVKIVFASEITPERRQGALQPEGYVWAGGGE